MMSTSRGPQTDRTGIVAYLFDNGQQAAMMHAYSARKQVSHSADLGQLFVRPYGRCIVYENLRRTLMIVSIPPFNRESAFSMAT